MKRLLTKESRLKVQEADFNSLQAQGYSRENYKGLIFWTKESEIKAGKVYTLKTYKANAAHALEYRNYGTEDRRAQVIAQYKAFHDRQEAYKAKVKAEGKPQSSQAQAAQAIREELKANFPGIKFSVTSEGYSMGNNVNVKWTDGPTEEQVNTLIGKYQAGHFNGMEDIYEYSKNPQNLPQTKYLFCTRLMSETSKEVIKAAFLEILPGEGWEAEKDRDREIRKLWIRSPLPAGATVTAVERGSEANSWTEAIVYTTPEQESKEAPTFEAPEVVPGTVQIIEYSAKSIAVIGDTKTIKDTLKSLGGKFNFRLTCGPGWIFKKSDLDKVTKALSHQAPDPESVPEELTAEEERQINETLHENEDFKILSTEKGMILLPTSSGPMHPEVEPAHPLNICDPESSQYKEALREHNTERQPSTWTSFVAPIQQIEKESARTYSNSGYQAPPAADQMEAAAAKLQAMAKEHREKMQTKSAEIAEEIEKIRSL